MKRYMKTAALIGFTVAPFAIAIAQSGGGFRGPPPYEAIDLNSDGRVTQDEMTQFRTERMKARSEQGYPMRNAGRAPSFNQVDTNGDGYISRQEMDAHRAARLAERPQRGGSGDWGPGYGPGYGPCSGYGYGYGSGYGPGAGYGCGGGYGPGAAYGDGRPPAID